MKIGDTFIESPSEAPKVETADSNVLAKARAFNQHAPEVSEDEQRLAALDPETRKFVLENQGIGGSLRVGAESAANEALFGIPELAYKHLASAQDVKEHEALKQFHQTANVVGGVAGALGSLAIGGPLFKAATEAGRLAEGAVLGGRAVEAARAAEGASEGVSIARALAAKAVGGAAQGAVVGAPRAVAEAVFGDPKEAAENLVMSAGIGGLLGPASFGLRKGAESVAEYAAPKIAEASENLATKITDELANGGENVKEKVKDYIGESIRDTAKHVGLYTHGIGGAVVGAGVGAIAKGVAEKVIEAIPEQYITKGLEATLAANKLAGKQLARLPEILDTLAEGSFAKAAKAAPSVFADLGKDIASQKNEYDSFKKLSEQVASNQATQNDQTIIGHNAAGLSHNADLQSQYSQTALNAVNYLQTIMPKNPNPIMPFSKNEWKPSTNQLQDFHNQLAVINNPYIVLDKLHDGTLTTQDVTTLQTVYPAIYSKIQQAVMSHAANPKYQDLPYGAKNKLSVLTGMPIDSTFDPKFILNMQSDFAKEQEQAAPKTIKSLDHIGSGPPKNQRISAGLQAES